MPRQGLGMPIVSGASNAPVTVIDDVLWEDFGGSGGEIAINYQETRTNSVLHSQDVTDAEAWTKTNTAIDSTLYEAPDNSTTANAIKSNSTGQKNYKITQSNLSVTADKTYTVSVHLKKENLGFARLKWTGGTARRTDFNLTTGAVTNTSNVIRTQVDAMDDGWFRCSMTFKADATETATLIAFAQSAAGDASPNIAVSGIVLIYVWGFQLEESIEATAYIVTTTSARTATTTLNDTSDVWDFDSADIMPEADPDSEGVWEVPANIVTNGGFDTDANWTKGTGWTISGGTASCDGSQSANTTLVQQQGILGVTLDIQVGNAYELIFTLTRSAGGITNTEVGGTTEGTTISSSGTHSKIITASSTNDRITFTATPDFIGSIDNVSVTEYAIQPQDV